MRSGQKDAVAVGSVAVVAQPAQLKRAQVPKACGNCRKMHAGCDTQRPCKRCKQNGLESTCEDIPRKKRYFFDHKLNHEFRVDLVPIEEKNIDVLVNNPI